MEFLACFPSQRPKRYYLTMVAVKGHGEEKKVNRPYAAGLRYYQNGCILNGGVAHHSWNTRTVVTEWFGLSFYFKLS